MLERIECEKFRKKVIDFRSGLNVVLGDDIASNSIGKSTLLMIIDFIFGGEDYIRKNSDAIEHLGHHSFKYNFNFYNEKLFFERSTDDYKKVWICNQKFERQNSLDILSYNKLLKKKYLCEIEKFSFREITGRYFRIYGKENLNEHYPLQYFYKEVSSNSILALIKLFNFYNEIAELEDNISQLNEQKKILEQAIKNNLIPNINSTIFKENKQKISELVVKLDDLKKTIVSSSINIEALITDDVLKLKETKSNLVLQRNILESRKRRVNKNIDENKSCILPELEMFSEFFPDLSLEKVKEIDLFHESLIKVLKKEIKYSSKQIINEINEISEKIKEVDNLIFEKLNIKDTPNLTVNKIVEISAQIKQLESENGYYENLNKIQISLKKLKTSLSEKKLLILDEIQTNINEKMQCINDYIYNGTRRTPVLQLEENRYVFKTEGDTGTGTAFANLITFDLALLNLTCLPAIAHDLPLLKNIENGALEKIVELYDKQTKQVFIAIDKLGSYSTTLKQIVLNTSVINLSKDETLFIKNWKKNRETNTEN